MIEASQSGFRPPSPSKLGRAVAACDRFEAAWRSGQSPRIEDFLAEAASPDRPRLARMLMALELELRGERGECPDPITYRERLPGYATQVEAAFAEAAADPPGGLESALPTIRGEGTEGAAWSTPPTVPGYEILGELGRGGMGVVYRARQLLLKRPCALKMILAGPHAGTEANVRFLAEAEAAARLRHPHVVQVYGIGAVDGLAYLELEYIEGGSLAARLEGRPWPARQAARLVEPLARAMTEAHRLGVVHRDLKPSNVLLAADGTPKVADFGLAKALDADGGLTRSHAILGSPSYMAPEQAEGKARMVGPAADVYALGAILYELLTGRPPFRGATALETLEQVKSAEPVPLSRLVPVTPRDAETIALKCPRKDPGRRYASAAALAEDLRRFLAGEPIRARRTGLLERAWRWARRNRTVTGLAASVALLLLTVATVSAVSAVWLNWARGEALSERNRALGAEAERAGQLRRTLLERSRAGRATRQAGQRFDGLAALAEAAKIRVDDELRNEAIACLALPDLRLERRFATRDVANHGWDVDPSMERYAVSDGQGNVIIRAVEDDRVMARLPGFGGAAYPKEFSRDGRYLMVAYEGGTRGDHMRLWDWDRDGPPRSVELVGAAWVGAFHPDGHQLATERQDGSIGIYKVATGQLIRRLGSGLPRVSLSFDAEGRRLAVTDYNGRSLRVFDVVGGEETSQPLEAAPWPVAWRWDGRLLAVGCDDQRIYVFDRVRQRLQCVVEGHASVITRLAFTRSGNLLFSTSWDGTTRVWDPVPGRALLVTRGEFRRIAPDDRRVGFIDFDRNLGTWELADGRECRVLHHGAIGNRTPRPFYWSPCEVDFAPGGRLLASTGTDGVRLWDLSHFVEVGHLAIGSNGSGRFHPAGDRFVTLGLEGLRLWPIRPDPAAGAGALRWGPPEMLRHPGEFFSATVRWGGGGRLLIANDTEAGRIVLFDPDRRRATAWLEVQPGSLPEISPDGRWVATSTSRGADVLLRDLSSGASRRLLKCGSARILFSPDGRWLATSDYSGHEYRLWRVDTWEPGAVIPADLAIIMAFSPDGRMLAVQQPIGRIQLVESESGRVLAMLEAPEGHTGIMVMAFSPDGGLLAASSGEHQVMIWDLRLLEAELAELGLGWDVRLPPPVAPPPRAEAPLRFRLEPDPEWIGPARRGEEAAQSGRWEDAREEFGRAVALGTTDRVVWRRALLIDLHSGDIARYHRDLATLLDQFGRGPIPPDDLNSLAWHAALRPDTALKPSPLAALMERAAEGQPTDYNGRKTLGVILYRAGRLPEAVRALEDAMRLHGGGGNASHWLFLSMCHRRLGHPHQADIWLEKALDGLERAESGAVRDPVISTPLSWEDRLEIQILAREARAMKGTSGPTELPDNVFAPSNGP
jgi:WD40 repeat protein